jgi:hypothetical protein
MSARHQYSTSADRTRAAVQLCEAVSNDAAMEEAIKAIWKDARRMFGWRDVATLEVGGSA